LESEFITCSLKTVNEPKICRSFKAVTCIKSKGGFEEDKLKKELDFDKWLQLSTGNK
jgi:hypothetical protein